MCVRKVQEHAVHQGYASSYRCSTLIRRIVCSDSHAAVHFFVPFFRSDNLWRLGLLDRTGSYDTRWIALGIVRRLDQTRVGL